MRFPDACGCTAQLPEAGARQATLEVTEDLAWKAKILLVDDNPENLLALEAGVRHDVEAMEQSAFVLTIGWSDATRGAASK